MSSVNAGAITSRELKNGSLLGGQDASDDYDVSAAGFTARSFVI